MARIAVVVTGAGWMIRSSMASTLGVGPTMSPDRRVVPRFRPDEAGLVGVACIQCMELARNEAQHDAHFGCLVTIGHAAPDSQETGLAFRISKLPPTADELGRTRRSNGREE